MDELTIGDKIYISSKRAAKITGYAKDYVGQLCREGRVEARLVGRNWYVLESSITEHRFGTVEDKKVVEEQKEPENKPYSWTSPTYVAETPVPVPSLIKKDPEVLASRKVVSEMQAAWQEWFAQQPEPSKVPEIETAHDVVDDASQGAEEEVVEFTAVHEEPRSTPEPVPATYEAPEEREYAYSAMTEVMDLSRTYEPVAEREVPEQEEQAHETYEADYRSGGMAPVLRALLIGSAFVASAAALVGTGVVGDLLLTSYGADSQLGKAIQYLGGESEYVNSSK